MLKSHKVNSRLIEMPARGPTLSEMRTEIRRRKRAQRKPIKLPSVTKVMQGLSKVNKALNGGLSKEAGKMPTESQINKELWG